MRKYFQQLENCIYLPEGTEGHGFDGPITVSSASDATIPMLIHQLSRNNISYLTGSPGKVEHLSAAVREVEGVEPGSPEALGNLMLRDPYPRGEYSEGIYMMVPAVTEKKIRSGARDWIIETVLAKDENGSQRYPLTLSMNSLVTRVLIDQSDEIPRAYGVEYMVGEALYAADQRYDPDTTGELRQVVASKEVIIAGGAFNTPQILKLSGVGPREELEGLRIPLVADVPAVVR
jgi:choline dehydrogenase